MPTVAAAAPLRAASFALLLRDRRPLEIAELAQAIGIDLVLVRAAATALVQAGWLDLDVAGRVIGAAGLSLTIGPHRLAIGSQHFHTWCAYDALGIAGALAADAQLATACGHCQAPISLVLHDGIPERDGPERLWLADGDGDLRGSFCTPTVLLCGQEHGQAWAQQQAGRGQLLGLLEGAQRGAIDWADCALATRALERGVARR
jgi:alkylmercury lyase